MEKIVFADMVLSTEGLVLIGTLSSALTGALVVIFKLLIANYDARLISAQKQYESQMADLKEQRNSYKEMVEESAIALEAKVNQLRASKGHPEFTPMAPVVPEHNSPTTPAQQETADLQTLRARLTAATLALGMPARQAEEPNKEELTFTTETPSTVSTVEKQVEAAEKQIEAAQRQQEAADKQIEAARKLEVIINKHEDNKI